jgi:2-phospho-L-lactate transferase/gluconeogenesis factor (CofD/UPF0052 family)
MNVVLFCGGRGSSNLIKELIDASHVTLTLIVNAYDDGLSTGEIRRLIPGMLGPSDFRKNLSLLLIPASKNHLVFSKILEHRLKFDRPSSKSIQSGNRLKKLSKAEILIEVDSELSALASLISSQQRKIIVGLMNTFLNRINEESKSFTEAEILRLNDYAIGNLLLAGAYIQHGNSFSKANDFLCSIFDIGARILNVSDENRYLVALTQQSELVRNEAQIVAGKFSGKIADIYLIPSPLTESDCRYIEELQTFNEKKSFLEGLEKIPLINPDIHDALRSADLIIFGSGTQHSSLFPSYKVLSRNGVTPLNWGGRASRIFVGNLDHDLDIEGWTGEEILRAFSQHFGGDPYPDLIDVVLTDRDSYIHYPGDAGVPEIKIEPIRNSERKNTHDGKKLLQQIYSVDSTYNQRDCDIVIKIPTFGSEYSRMRDVVQSWNSTNYEREINCSVTTELDPSRAAIAHYNRWINEEKGSRFLVLYACEGETNLNDIVAGIEFMEAIKIGVLSGSRTQSRRQWLTTTGKTYGEGRLRFNLSIIAMLIAVTTSMIRRQQLLTDPLSRCLLLDRYALNLKQNFVKTYNGRTIPGLRTFLTSKSMDVAEFPIHYKVFKGFRAFVNPTKDAINGFIEIMKLPK